MVEKRERKRRKKTKQSGEKWVGIYVVMLDCGDDISNLVNSCLRDKGVKRGLKSIKE
jgi:hypothetical protein